MDSILSLVSILLSFSCGRPLCRKLLNILFFQLLEVAILFFSMVCIIFFVYLNPMPSVLTLFFASKKLLAILRVSLCDCIGLYCFLSGLILEMISVVLNLFRIPWFLSYIRLKRGASIFISRMFDSEFECLSMDLVLCLKSISFLSCLTEWLLSLQRREQPDLTDLFSEDSMLLVSSGTRKGMILSISFTFGFRYFFKSSTPPPPSQRQISEEVLLNSNFLSSVLRRLSLRSEPPTGFSQNYMEGKRGVDLLEGVSWKLVVPKENLSPSLRFHVIELIVYQQKHILEVEYC